MKNILQRLQRLESAYQMRQDCLTVFRLDNGSLFHAKEDPITYLLKNGFDTGVGKIVDLVDPPGEGDPITSAVYEEIRSIIAGGDEIGNEGF